MAAHSWENRPLNIGNDDNDDDDDHRWGIYSGDELDDINTETTAGMEFVRFVLNLFYTSALSAKVFCNLMWLAARAGISEAAEYGLKPGSPSGHYFRKVKSVLRWHKHKKFMVMHVPGQGKHDLERTIQTVHVQPGHEQLIDDYKANLETCERNLAQLKADNQLPPSYWHHPVVQGAALALLVFPIAIYLDGVPYSLTDSVVGIWLISLIDSRRYLIAVIRKRILCKCGCKGWCTLWHFFAMLHWDLQAGARGQYAAERYDGPWWSGSDDARMARASQPFGFKLALMYIKGDWMELGVSIGLPTWADSLRPCFCCNAYFDNLFDTTGMTIDDFIWLINDDNAYFEAASKCEIIVALRNAEDMSSIVQFLRYDKRKQGSAGRALVRNIIVNGANLKANDRLEPSVELPDIGELENLEVFPVSIVFWRPQNETLTRHRNPLFDEELGITPKRSLVIDILHAFFLGILLVWCRFVLWRLILAGAYGHAGMNYENFGAVVLVLRSNLMRFYSRYESLHKGEKLTRVSDMVPKMLGEPNDQKLKTKGAETWGICVFLIAELEQKKEFLGDDGTRLLHAGHQLEQMVRTWKAFNWTMPAPKAKDLGHECGLGHNI
jgi:hypothetical protein